ncbi:hypothetical protein BV25DRAFT_821652 [Artomyces pyxidatus]|uniref:Uncharacterized protein n=1 Tax=Artomyces pyxidatus TaxID=48021 RepID=A0ACB8SYM8_9AGAM|nr:hypothetical protein BV25DRAFT_821652 [Artomyces pyxidatus]
MSDSLEPEDILASSLESLYDYTPITHSTPGALFKYTSPNDPELSITLSTPDTAAENWSLHASSIWVSALYIADHLSELGIPDTETTHILELGAGAGLPSILIAKAHPRVHVVASDYPDDNLIHALEQNVARNDVAGRCRVVPHAWGADSTALGSPFDVVVAADTLWNSAMHASLLTTLCGVLARTPGARVHLVAGLHTGRYTLGAFLREAEGRGFVVAEAVEREVSGVGQRAWDVERDEGVEAERERRKWVVWMVLRWGREVV